MDWGQELLFATSSSSSSDGGVVGPSSIPATAFRYLRGGDCATGSVEVRDLNARFVQTHTQPNRALSTHQHNIPCMQQNRASRTWTPSSGR